MPEDRDALLHAHPEGIAKPSHSQRQGSHDVSSRDLRDHESDRAHGGQVSTEIVAEAPRSVPFGVVADVAKNQQKGRSRDWRRIVSCDFCTLHWHLDCVDPPMISMPHDTRKWMCPNHVDQAAVSGSKRLVLDGGTQLTLRTLQPAPRVAKATAAQQQVVDLPVPSASSIGPGRHYRTRVRNNGLIDIIPDPLDEIFDPATGRRRGSNAWMLDEVDIDEDEEVGELGQKVKLRIPERVILLDFWQRVRHEQSAVQAVAPSKRRT